MPNLKAPELRKMKTEELEAKLSELKAELVKLKSASARGTIGKQSGKIRILRHNIARILTVLRELKAVGGRGK
jgi:large subunit ribosomal protein L29